MPTAANLYYHLYEGQGSSSLPVILIHGAGGMHLSWPPEIRRLNGYRVYAVDLPGHGKSEAMGGLQTVQAYAEQVYIWMQAVELSRAVLVGHSMGGAIAMTLALDHPRCVAGLSLISSGANLWERPDLLENAMSATSFFKAIEIFSSWLFSSEASPQLVKLVSERLAEVRPSVLYGDLLACERFNLFDGIANIRKPTLVICGAEDKLTPVRSSQHLEKTIPSARLKILPQAGHMVILEQPQAVADALHDFLAELPYLSLAGENYVPGD